MSFCRRMRLPFISFGLIVVSLVNGQVTTPRSFILPSEIDPVDGFQMLAKKGRFFTYILRSVDFFNKTGENFVFFDNDRCRLFFLQYPPSIALPWKVGLICLNGFT